MRWLRAEGMWNMLRVFYFKGELITEVAADIALHSIA